jgi:hypothetical protein
VSGIEATHYLESKGVNVLLNPCDFMAKTKLDLEEAARKGGFRVPGNTANKFPKIVKYVDGLASIRMDGLRFHMLFRGGCCEESRIDEEE